MELPANPMHLALGALLLVAAGCQANDPAAGASDQSRFAAEEELLPPIPPLESSPQTAAVSPEKVTENADSTATENPATTSAESTVVNTSGEQPAIAESVKVNQAAATRPTPPIVTAAEGGVRLLIPEKTFRSEGKSGALRVSYDDIDLLRILNMEPVPADAVSQFPSWLSDLNGKQVRIRGFMYPTFEERVPRFILARDNEICCFGKDPKPYDLITVQMRDGTEARYIQNRPFDVVGTFRIAPVYQDGLWLRLYAIVDASVIE